MAIDLRCVCGLVVHVDKDAAPSCRVCPCCGERLRLSFSARTGDQSFAAEVPLIPLDPHYEVEPSTPADDLTYRVVEVPGSTGPARDGPARDGEAWTDRARSSGRTADEDREVRRILAQAKRDIRRYRYQPRGGYVWPLERSGPECLLFPLRVSWLIGLLGMLWAMLTPIMVRVLPTPDDATPAGWLVRLPIITIALFLLGVTWNFFREILYAGASGKREIVTGYFFMPGAIVQSTLMAVLAFVAGPLLFIGAALWFWMDAGELTFVDHLLLWQLGLCACVAWIYLLLAMDARGSLRDAHAAAVSQHVLAQGGTAWVFPLSAAFSLALFIFLQLQLWRASFEQPVGSWFAQILLWLGALYLWTALVRWYGLTRFWRRTALAADDDSSL
jgi:hypothetical protein